MLEAGQGCEYSQDPKKRSFLRKVQSQSGVDFAVESKDSFYCCTLQYKLNCGDYSQRLDIFSESCQQMQATSSSAVNSGKLYFFHWLQIVCLSF